MGKKFLRLKKAVVFSIKGIKSTWAGEEAFRQEVVIAAILIPLAFYLPVSMAVRFILIASVFGVLIVELINSAIEAVVDLCTEERHPLAGKAKDAGSAAVFLALIFTGAVWAIVLYFCYVESSAVLSV